MEKEKDLLTYQLKNGMQVMLLPIHTTPIVSSWVWYKVGSRNEQPGKTGVSHWVEHMQFKGTTHRSASEMDHSIARVGGFWNAFTSTDFTTYYETLPAHSIQLALELEADRMQNAVYDPEEVETERTVIISEREGSENEPRWQLSEAVNQVSYLNHPYRNEVIGSKADLLSMTRDDLFEHYQAHYQPQNAMLCVAGDFVVDQIQELVQRHFGRISGASLQTSTPKPESALPDLQRIELSGPGETTYIQVAYRAPKADDIDFFAFTILDSLLAGPSSLNMFGTGGVSNRTSRLYLSLVESEYAVSVSGGLNASIDPCTYDLQLTLHPANNSETLLAQLDRQLQMISDGKITQFEVDKAIKQARALFAYGSDNITNQAFWMGYSNIFADYSWFTQYIDRLRQVRLEDVVRVARTYLDPNHRVIGIFHPEEA